MVVDGVMPQEEVMMMDGTGRPHSLGTIVAEVVCL